jgi:tetraacyldisaccharide 4'-kinase
MRAPGFWQRDGLLPALLMPAAACFAAGGWLRRRIVAPKPAAVPVLCVGNLVAGGAGKTPVAAALAERLLTRGRAAHFLSRGYGGRERGPLRVDPRRHTAADVGDEPLLLARIAPAWIARDRAAGADAAAAACARVVVMDDGFQNPGLAKDMSLLVVDGGYGFGNGRTIPAGPLLEPLRTGLSRADAVVLMGPDECGVERHLPASLPVLRAALLPAAPESLAGRRVLAFAGIARPEKFFATLEALGCRVAGRRAFSDHHPYTDDEIAALAAEARRADAMLVTTEKDAARLPAATMASAAIETVPVTIRWRDEAAVDRLLERFY